MMATLKNHLFSNGLLTAHLNLIILPYKPFAKLRFLFKIKACEKFYHRHMIDIPRIKF